MADLHQILDILLAFALGAAIGAEREWRVHPGGLRSCALVAAASSGFVRLMLELGGNNMAAALGAIATGIGFLGAGVIITARRWCAGFPRQRPSGRWRRWGRPVARGNMG